MAAAIALRGDFDAARCVGCEEDEGWPSGPAASGAGGDLRRCDAHGGGEDRRRDAADHPGLGGAVQRAGPDGLIDRKAPGQPSRLNDAHRQALARDDRERPDPGDPWRGALAAHRSGQWIFEEFRITVAKQTLSRELRAMGYRKLSARPRHHAQAEGAIEDFKKASPPAWRRSRARRASTPAT